MHKVDANKRFLSYSEYVTLGRHFVNKISRRYSYNLDISDDELVDKLTDADLKFNPSKNCTLSTFRYVYLRNFVWSVLRHKKKPRKKDQTVSLDHCPELSREDFSFARVEDRDYLNKLFKRAELTTRQKKILELYYYKELNFREIARRYKCSRQNIGIIIGEIRTILAKEAECLR